MQVAGASVLPDKAGQPHLVRASPLEIEVASQTAGELRATLSADWLPKPLEHKFALDAGRTTTIAIPLPESGERDPAKFQIVLEREDGAGVRRELTVIRDRTRPKVSFRAYGVAHEPSQDTPLRVVRIQDVSAVVEDAGGFDEAGKAPGSRSPGTRTPTTSRSRASAKKGPRESRGWRPSPRGITPATSPT